jgi:hypothetical protein
MYTCKEATLLASQGLERRLRIRERFNLMIHMYLCDACALFRKQIDVMRRAMRRADAGSYAGEGVTLPPEIRARIVERLRSFM